MQYFDTSTRSAMEIWKDLPEGTLAEVINGTLFMSPAPSVRHQIVVRDIVRALDKLVQDGVVDGMLLFAPCDVYLHKEITVVQPDIMLMLAENTEIVSDNGLHGVPDLIVEILSPNNLQHDLVRKNSLYERHGVKEYWVVNPRTKESYCYFLQGRKFCRPACDRGRVYSRLLGNLTIEF